MKRRPLGRDLGLTIRMAVALIPDLRVAPGRAPAPRRARDRHVGGSRMGRVSRRGAVRAMWHAENLRGKILFLLFYWPVSLVSLFLMWTLSRSREYVADRRAALITGAPEQLMSAMARELGKPA